MIDFEFCKYGYWVGPEGEVEPIDGYQRHYNVAREVADEHGVIYDLSPSQGITQMNAYGALYEAGWITITMFDKEIGLEAWDWSAKRQLSVVKDIIKTFMDLDYNVNINDTTYTRYGDVIKYLNKMTSVNPSYIT